LEFTKSFTNSSSDIRESLHKGKQVHIVRSAELPPGEEDATQGRRRVSRKGQRHYLL
jgi:hypothetical protein